MLNGDPPLLSHGWTPETGFIKSRWARYSEFTIIYFLGIGSPTHAIDPESWYAWERPENVYGQYKYVGLSPLFTHSIRKDSWITADVASNAAQRSTGSKNSVTATRAHRQFCIDLAGEFPGYSENIWGITSSNSATGYKAWGGPPRNKAIDGTVVPCAAGGSLMLAPDICLPALQAMKARFGGKIYGRYGFTDAFHPTSGSPCLARRTCGLQYLEMVHAESGDSAGDAVGRHVKTRPPRRAQAILASLLRASWSNVLISVW